MKIAIFTDTFFPQRNGVITAICNTLDYLCKNHQITIFIPGKKNFKYEKKSKNLTIIKIPSFKFYQYKGYRISKPKLKKISKIMEKKNFDIIHVHTPFTLGIVGITMSRLYSIPIVGTYHTYLPEYLPHITKGKFYNLIKGVGKYPSKRYTKFVYSKFDCVIAPSKEIARILRDCGIKKIKHIPNGIKLEKFNFNKRTVEKVRKKYRIPKDKKILLYLGRVSFEKKLEVLFEAFKLLENKHKNVFLLVVGSGPYLKNYKNKAKELKIKNIRFTGFIKDEFLPSMYYSSDIFVSPSDTEICPLTFIEAMTCGLPVVGVRKGGVKDIVKHNKNGLLAKPNNPKDLARKIEILLNDEELMKKMSRENKRYVRSYSIKKICNDLLRIYKKIKITRKIHPFIKAVDIMIHPYKIKMKFSNL